MVKNIEKVIYEIFGKKLIHLSSGRPFFSEEFDISISHKDNIVEAKIVSNPYRIGIDVENIFPDIRAELFLGSVIAKKEVDFLNKFRQENNLSLGSAVAIFWSIKESFFKCLDYDLKPGKIIVSNFAKDGNVKVILSPEIDDDMKRKGLEIFSIEAIIKGNYVYSETIMKALLL